MILPDWMIDLLATNHNLVTPYDPSLINPASLDLRLGRTFINRSQTPISYILNSNSEIANPGETFEADRVTLIPGVALLATTQEYFRLPAQPFMVDNPFFSALNPQPDMPPKILMHPLVGTVYLKSSSARRGLDHALAGYVDPGFEGELTLELHSHTEEELIAGRCYVQLAFTMLAAAPLKSYQLTGRYMNQTGPTEAKEPK